MSDISIPTISTSGTNEDPVYLLFKEWYFTSINRFFLHNQSSEHFTFYHNLFTYLIIVFSGISAFLSGLNLVLVNLDMNNAVIGLTVLSLFVSLFAFIIGTISKTRDFGERAEQHTKAGDHYLRIAEDIIKLFTPLSKAEADLNIASERTFIQQKIAFYTKIAPGIPSRIVKEFNKQKYKSKRYINYIKIFKNINNDDNYLFANTHEQILEDIGYDEEQAVPNLQQMFNNLRGQ